MSKYINVVLNLCPEFSDRHRRTVSYTSPNIVRVWLTSEEKQTKKASSLGNNSPWFFGWFRSLFPFVLRRKSHGHSTPREARLHCQPFPKKEIGNKRTILVPRLLSRTLENRQSLRSWLSGEGEGRGGEGGGMERGQGGWRGGWSKNTLRTAPKPPRSQAKMTTIN